MKKGKKLILENLLYEENITERLHPKLEEDLRESRHSLSECGIMPEGDEMTSEMKLIRERFKEVVNRCRSAFDVDEINNREMMQQQMPLVRNAIQMESNHKEFLQELAVKMVSEEFDIPEGAIQFEAELTNNITLEGTISNKGPQRMEEEFEFNNHDELVNANSEVKKRRVLNAMTQGAAKKVNHMFHMVNDELVNLNPRLPNIYNKMMSAADYMFFIIPNMEKMVSGGKSECDFSGEAPKVKAQAMVFPVLVHELCKGVMEVLSSHGLPKKKKIAVYVINKADFIEAEPWDMRLGPAIWGKFCKAMPDEDFNLKHHVYADMASLPPKDFNPLMKEIISGTKKSKKVIQKMVNEIKEQIKEDEFNEAMGDQYFNEEDLLG